MHKELAQNKYSLVTHGLINVLMISSTGPPPLTTILNTKNDWLIWPIHASAVQEMWSHPFFFSSYFL